MPTRDPLRESIVLRRAILRQRESHINRHYAETAGRITEKWKPSNKSCDCTRQDEGAHNRVSVKTTNGKWGNICPIKYYLWLAWKAISEKYAVPSEELYWELLGKPMPERKRANPYEHS